MAASMSTIVRALEGTWRGLQRRHKDLPDVNIVVGGTGSDDGATAIVTPGGTTVMVSRERLTEGALPTFRSLAHQATHALAVVRGVTDTSREGRYHNTTFADLALTIGLEDTGRDSRSGYAALKVPQRIIERYGRHIDRLDAVLKDFEIHPADQADQRDRTSYQLRAECSCVPPVTFRIARTQFNRGPIHCPTCDTDFRLST